MRRLTLLSVFLIFLTYGVNADATASDLSLTVQPTGGDFVMGRPIESEFSYSMDGQDPVQVSFVIDDTGSMGGEIDGIKSNIKDFFNDLGPDARGSIVTFKDSPEIDQTFTSDESTLESAVDSISAGGGGDCEEDASGGLDTAYNDLNWQSGERRIVILVVGAGVHDPNRIENLADDFANDGYTAFSVTDSLSCGGSDAVRNYLPDETGGENYSFGTDWNQILQEISDSVSDAIGNLLAVVDSSSYSTDNYDIKDSYSGHDRYNYSDVNTSEGGHSITHEWRYTDYGNLYKTTGDSALNITQSSGSVYTYSFASQESVDVKYVDFELMDFTVERDDTSVDIEAKIANNGNIESLDPSATSNPRQLWLKDSSNHALESIPSISPGTSTNISFSVGNSNAVVDGVNIEDLILHADPDGFWDGLGSETAAGEAEGKTLEPNEDDNLLEVGYPPLVENIQFTDISGQHAFSVEADVSILTDGSDFGECRLKFTNLENGEEHPENGRASGNLTEENDNTAICTYDNFNSSVSGFNPTDNVQVNVTAENDEGATGWNSDTHEIINRPPQVTALTPTDGDPVTSRDATLEIQVDDPEGDDIQLIEFRNEENGNIIESFPNPPQQPQYSAQWEDLDLGVYEWNVEVWDSWDSQLRGPFEFERVVSQIYRVQHMIDHQYSSLIVEEGGQSFLFFESDVATNNRTVTTYLEGNGIDAEYIGGSTRKTYEVDTGNPERFQVKVEGIQSGYQELNIITEDETVTTNTTTTFPVYVRESTTEGQSVPGLSPIYLLIIFLFSSLVYFVSL